MSKFIFAFALLIIAYSASAQTMIFDEKTIDYGQVEQRSDGMRVFTFTNTGSEPLIIKNVKGTCSCVGVSYPDKPILPNERGEIIVKYDTNRIGAFSYRIMGDTNIDDDGNLFFVTITGEILKSE